MTATLYRPNQAPLEIVMDNFQMLDSQGYVVITEQVANLLECRLGLVDVLASSTNYVIFSVFDSEEVANLSAMATIAALTGQSFNPNIEDEIIGGNILIINNLS